MSIKLFHVFCYTLHKIFFVLTAQMFLTTLPLDAHFGFTLIAVLSTISCLHYANSMAVPPLTGDEVACSLAMDTNYLSV